MKGRINVLLTVKIQTGYVQDVVANVVKILQTLKKDKHRQTYNPKRRLRGCLVSGEEGSTEEMKTGNKKRSTPQRKESTDYE